MRKPPIDSLTALLALAAAVAAASCQKDAAKSGEPPQKGKTLGSEQAAGGVKIEGLRKLALVSPQGSAAIDRQIVDLQGKTARDPTKVDTWILLGRAWVQKARQAADPGFYANANACADIALDLKPKYPLALDLRGMVLMNDHRFREALDLAKTILAEDQDDVTALGEASDASLELGEFEEATKYADKMNRLKPNLPSYARISYLRWLKGDFDGAKTTIRQAIDAGGGQRDPEPGAWVLTEAAKLFYHRGDYPGAEVGFDQALAKMPDYPPALLGKARVELALGKLTEAAVLAKKAYEAAPLADAAWVWGDAERAAGHAEIAKDAYDRLIRLGRQGDRRTLALFFATENRDLPDARQEIETELKRRGDIYTHDAYAWVLYRLGKLPEAKAASDKATRLGTKDALLLYHAGAIRLASGDTEGGLAQVKEALALNPKFQLTGAAEAAKLVETHGVAKK